MDNVKSWLAIGLLMAIIAGAVVATNAVEFTAQGLFVFTIGLWVGLQIAWDRTTLKDYNTKDEITKGNVAYALVFLAPTFACIAGAIAMQG